MKNLRNEYKLMYEKFPVGEKIIFDNFEFDKLSLKSIFYLKKSELIVKKHGFFSVGDNHWVNLYFDNGVHIQICYNEGEIVTYWIFKTLERHFLRNSFDRAFWLGAKDERGLLFYDDYFYGRDPWKFFEEFLEHFCSVYFKDFDCFDEIEYEVEDAYCKTNLIEILKNHGIKIEKIKKSLSEELKKREWIIDYVFNENDLEIYYHFNEGDLDKRFSFMKNTSYAIKMVDNGVVYDKKVLSSLFQRKVEDEFFEKEYIGMVYEEELSLILLTVGIPIDISDFKRGK